MGNRDAIDADVRSAHDDYCGPYVPQVCPAGWTRWQCVATRIGLAQLNGRKWCEWQPAVGLLRWMGQVPIGQSPPHVAHNSGGLTLTASMVND